MQWELRSRKPEELASLNESTFRSIADNFWWKRISFNSWNKEKEVEFVAPNLKHDGSVPKANSGNRTWKLAEEQMEPIRNHIKYFRDRTSLYICSILQKYIYISYGINH